jgi:hypothetical protein
MRRINALFYEGNAGKPHLLPEAEKLLREYRAYKQREIAKPKGKKQ